MKESQDAELRSHPLPNEGSTENSPPMILNKADRELATALLTALSKQTLSRTALLEVLKDISPQLSDYHLRQLIEFLRQSGMLRVNKGRRGMELTSLGARFIGL